MSVAEAREQLAAAALTGQLADMLTDADDPTSALTAHRNAANRPAAH